ncbi:MAG: TetR/AcrR family transcriptional regulator [Myxococcota bacterium]
MSRSRTKYADVRQACLDEARRILQEDGPEKLSLRTVARRLGISHQAPYKHFASKDAVIAELVRQAYADFAVMFQSLPETGDPDGDMRQMGEAYLAYALEHPAEYRLMFGIPLPEPSAHPEMLEQAQAVFEHLRQRLSLRQGAPDEDALDALFIWSTLHGLASILELDASRRLALSAAGRERVANHVLDRIRVVLDTPRSGSGD